MSPAPQDAQDVRDAQIARDAMKPLIYAASEGPLSRAQATEAFRILFEGAATPSQIGGLLMAMRARGESVAEYAA
ncbi:MAG: hypothetical protein ACU0CO_07655, partial [Shimia sp.]